LDDTWMMPVMRVSIEATRQIRRKVLRRFSMRELLVAKMPADVALVAGMLGPD
jgi:hypothetical protein